MNNAIGVLLCIGALMYLSLAVVLVIRARQQFGFLAPLGFVCAVILRIICQAATTPMYSHMAESFGQEKVREIASKMSDDDRLFYLSLSGQADGIWHLGAMLFLLCGLLDLKTAAGGFPSKARTFLVIGGGLLIVLSAFYPIFWFERLR